MAGVRLSRARLSVRLSEPLHGDGGGHDQAVSVHGQRPGAPAHGDRGNARSALCFGESRVVIVVKC